MAWPTPDLIDVYVVSTQALMLENDSALAVEIEKIALLFPRFFCGCFYLFYFYWSTFSIDFRTQFWQKNSIISSSSILVFSLSYIINQNYFMGIPKKQFPPTKPLMPSSVAEKRLVSIVLTLFLKYNDGSKLHQHILIAKQVFYWFSHSIFAKN